MPLAAPPAAEACAKATKDQKGEAGKIRRMNARGSFKEALAAPPDLHPEADTPREPTAREYFFKYFGPGLAEDEHELRKQIQLFMEEFRGHKKALLEQNKPAFKLGRTAGPKDPEEESSAKDKHQEGGAMDIKEEGGAKGQKKEEGVSKDQEDEGHGMGSKDKKRKMKDVSEPMDKKRKNIGIRKMNEVLRNFSTELFNKVLYLPDMADILMDQAIKEARSWCKARHRAKDNCGQVWAQVSKQKLSENDTQAIVCIKFYSNQTMSMKQVVSIRTTNKEKLYYLAWGFERMAYWIAQLTKDSSKSHELTAKHEMASAMVKAVLQWAEM